MCYIDRDVDNLFSACCRGKFLPDSHALSMDMSNFRCGFSAPHRTIASPMTAKRTRYEAISITIRCTSVIGVEPVRRDNQLYSTELAIAIESRSCDCVIPTTTSQLKTL